MSEESLNNNLQRQDEILKRRFEKELNDLRIPEEENFQGNTQLYQEAMHKYLNEKSRLESQIKHLESQQRKIARGDLSNGFGIN